MSDKISVSREELRVFFWAVIDSCAAEHYGSEIEGFDRKLNGCIDKLFTPSPSAAVCEWGLDDPDDPDCDTWYGNCGGSFHFEEPLQKGDWNYCPNCGLAVVVKTEGDAG